MIYLNLSFYVSIEGYHNWTLQLIFMLFYTIAEVIHGKQQTISLSC